MLEGPLPADLDSRVQLVKVENISSLPGFTSIDVPIEAPVIVVAGANYEQGSSREHAAITPRYLG